MLKKRKMKMKQLLSENEQLHKKVVEQKIKFNKLEEEFIKYKNKVNNKK